MSKFSVLFGLAKELSLGIDDLRELAAQIGGKRSLRSLNARQLRALEQRLREQRDGIARARRKDVRAEFLQNALLGQAQFDYLVDLVADVFGKMAPFRSWLERYHGIGSERWIDTAGARKIIKALEEMRERNFKV